MEDAAIRTVRQANQQKMYGTLDLLGENTRTREDAIKACQEVMTIWSMIQTDKVDCNVSVKLTQLGLALDQDFARQNLLQIAGRARDRNNYVRWIWRTALMSRALWIS